MASNFQAHIFSKSHVPWFQNASKCFKPHFFHVQVQAPSFCLLVIILNDCRAILRHLWRLLCDLLWRLHGHRIGRRIGGVDG